MFAGCNFGFKCMQFGLLIAAIKTTEQANPAGILASSD
jgi:hypothetical protein